MKISKFSKYQNELIRVDNVILYQSNPIGTISEDIQCVVTDYFPKGEVLKILSFVCNDLNYSLAFFKAKEETKEVKPTKTKKK